MSDLADEIYEATGMILGREQAAAMTRFIELREALVWAAARNDALDLCDLKAREYDREAKERRSPHAKLECEASAETARELAAEIRTLPPPDRLARKLAVNWQ